MKYWKIVTLSLLLGSCGQQQDWVRNRNVGTVFGTTYAITYLSKTPVDFQQEIDSVFDAVNRSMSTYLLDSDITKINQGDSTVVVDTMFKEVFELSEVIYNTSNGYFDPTVGTLVNAWGFGPGETIALDSTKVDSLLQYVGFNKVQLTEANKIQKATPEIFFDFNAIAKGYAIDRVGLLLAQQGIADFLIEVGGEVLTKGENRISKQMWTVGIDDPQATAERELKKIVSLKDAALASSGNYRKFRIDTLTGEKYVHTIDPKTGYTKNAKVLAASVIASDCATADGYATAFMALELEATKKILAAQQDMEAYLIFLDEGGNTREFITDGFQALVRP
ncbi:MAG: FAD:protein FMN transferase [Bacteroidota bacterium]